MASEVEGEHEREFACISELVSACERQCRLDVTVLSAASKIHHLVEKGMNLPQAAEYTAGLQWIVNEEDVSKGATLLRKLHLVS